MKKNKKTVPLFFRLVVWSFVIFIAFMIILWTKIIFWEGFKVPSASMTPTLRVGDLVWVDKSAYGISWPGKDRTTTRVPEYNDIVVFLHPQTQEYYVKRVIGRPGDTVLILGPEVFVNGKKIETFIPQNWNLDSSWTVDGQVYKSTAHHYVMFSKEKQGWSLSGYWEVPKDNLFVLGDLRDESSDSREWGFVPLSSLVGKAKCIIDAGYMDNVSVLPRSGCHLDQKSG